MTNITPNSDVLVLYMIGGLLTGVVAERLGGSICNISLRETPYHMDIVRIFNFDSEICKSPRSQFLSKILLCSLGDLSPSKNGTCEQIIEYVDLYLILKPYFFSLMAS